MAVVTHLIILVRHRVFAFTRLMPVTSALALALILGHLVPPYGTQEEAEQRPRAPSEKADNERSTNDHR